MATQEQVLEKDQENQANPEGQKELNAPKSHDDFVGSPKTELEPEEVEEKQEETVPTEPVAEKTETEEEDTEDDPGHASIAELEISLRTLTAQVQALNETIAQRDKVLEENGLLQELDPELVKQAERDQAVQDNYLRQLYEVMRVNPSYPGMEEVLSVENQNAIIRDYARVYAEENGVSQIEAEQAVYQGIMAQPNPILWYYEKITSNYYESQKSQETTKPGNETKKETKPNPAVVQKAPPSLGNTTASLENHGAGTYTMKRLDNMSELQLTQVPSEIRDKYLSGDLPEE